MFESKPFRLIQTAVERQTKESDTRAIINRSLREGLKAMTINAAWQIQMEDKIGSLEKNKLADLIPSLRSPHRNLASTEKESFSATEMNQLSTSLTWFARTG